MVIMMKDIDDWLDRDFHKWFLRIINTKKKKKSETYIVSQPVHGQKLVSCPYQWRKISVIWTGQLNTFFILFIYLFVVAKPLLLTI